MSEHTWADLADDDLDEVLRREMSVLQATAVVPRVDATRLSPARVRIALRDPAAPRRLAPAALAVGLAVLVAMGSGTWVTVQRLHGRGSAPAATPSAAPRVTPAPSPGELPGSLHSTVPAGVSVVWYALQAQSSNDAVRLEAVDWSGKPRGHIDIPGITMPSQAGGALGITQSPDGERLIVLNSAGAGSTVYSSDGHRLYDLPTRTPGTPIWADDSRTICLVTPDFGGGVHATDLVILDGDGTPRPDTSVLTTHADTEFVLVHACSVSTDRVVDYVHVNLDRARVQVRKLSSNQILLDQTICAPPADCNHPVPDNVSVSANGRVAAESDMNGQVRIRDLTSGAVRTLSQRGGVLKISADGTRLLLGRPDFVYGGPVYPLTLIDVSTGKVLWTHVESGVLGSDVGAQPGGSAIAVAYSAYDHNAAPPPGAQNPYIPSPPSTLALLTGSTARTIAIGVHSLFFRSD